MAQTSFKILLLLLSIALKFAFCTKAIITEFQSIPEYYKDVLDLGIQLRIFENCHVHIVVAHISGFSTQYSRKYHASYDILPPGIPWLYSVHKFEHVWILGLTFCDGWRYSLREGQKYRFNATAHNRPCEVLVYVPPYRCTQWGTHTTEGWGGRLVPEDFFTLYRTPMLSRDAIFRPMRFLAYVTKSSSTLIHNSIFKLTEYESGFKIAGQVTFPTKLLFLIVNSKNSTKSPPSVITTFIVGRPILGVNQFRRAKSNCQQKYSGGILQMHCMDTAFDNLSYRLVPYDPKTVQTHTLAFFSKNLFSDEIVIQSNCELERQRGSRGASSFRDWERGDDISLTLFRTIAGNVSILQVDPTHHFSTSHKATFAAKLTSEVSEYFRDEADGLYFITCAGIHEVGVLDGKGYLSAYDDASWAILLSFVVVTGGVLLLHLSANLDNSTTKKLRVPSFSDIYSPLAYGPLVLLEQGVDLVDKFRWISGPWILMGVVLSNAYRGENINLLIAPIPIKRLQSFEEMMEHNFTIHSTNSMSNSTALLKHLAFQSFNEVFMHMSYGVIDGWLSENPLWQGVTTGGRIKRDIQQDEKQNNNAVGSHEDYSDKVLTYEEAFAYIEEPFNKSYASVHRSAKSLNVYQSAISATVGYLNKTDVSAEGVKPLKWLLEHTYFPKTVAQLHALEQPRYFIDKISECGRDAFVSTYQSVRKVFWRMKSEFLPKWSGRLGDRHDPDGIIMGTKEIVKLKREWSFRNMPWSYDELLRRVRVLSESGFAFLWYAWERRIASWNDALEYEKYSEPPVRKVTMSDNISIVFIVYGICILFPSASFLIEMIWRRNDCRKRLNTRKRAANNGDVCSKMMLFRLCSQARYEGRRGKSVAPRRNMKHGRRRNNNN